MTDAGLIFITALPAADDYTIERLSLLNQPNDLLVVSIEEVDQRTLRAATITLLESTPRETGLAAVLSLLASNHVIPEYCI